MKNRATLINILSNFLLQVVTIISGFILPKIILSFFGSSVNGLVASLNQFLSYITLIEGGVTSVVAANLYKPLVNHENDKISSILATAKKFYRSIGYIFIAYSIGLAIVYPLVLKTDFSWLYVSGLTIILSMNLMIQYMFSLSMRTLLNADKKAFVVSFSQIAITILNIVLAYVSVRIYPSIHILKLISGMLFLIQPIVFGRYIEKHYKIDWKAETSDSLLSQRWNGFAINLAAFIHNSTDVTVLTIFTDLQTVSVYSVYVLVTSGLSRLIQAITSAISPTVGQAYARQDERELQEKLDLYEYITFFLVGFFFTIAGLLITPFVILYTSGVKDAEYYQPLFGALIVLSEALYLIKFPHLSLAYSANKFKELTVPAFLEAGINIVISISLVTKLGLVGVAIGTICGMIYRLFFHIYFTTKFVPSRGQWIYYRKLIIVLLATITGIALCVVIFPLRNITIMNWIIHGIVYSLILGALYALVSYLFFKHEVKYFVSYIRKK